MRHYFIKSISISARFRFIILLITGLVFCFCKEEPQLWTKKSEELLAGEYIDSNPDQFSEFEKLIEATRMKALLNVRGPYTVFLPNNTAMFAYYKLKKANSLTDFDAASLQNLIRNHIIVNEIATADIGLGTLRDTNAIGDYLVTEFQESDIILNKTSRIIKRDIRTANGYIHVVDKVLDPITKDIYGIISSDPSYKLFTEGLKLTGIKDTLQLISFPYGKYTERTRFTILAVADTIYQRYGIYSVGDLIKWCGASPDSLTNLNNPFYRYIEYHCLKGSYYLSDLETVPRLYPVLSGDNNIRITVDTDYKINPDRKSKKYTGFIIPASNIPARNGALHAINDILPVTQPEPTEVTFETTNFFDFKQGDYYGKYYQRFYDGKNDFTKIHWEGDYLLYFYRAHDPNQPGLIKDDGLRMMGWWTISITFPKLMKGKYNVSIYQPGFITVPDCIVYIDGMLSPYIYTGPRGNRGGNGGLQKIAVVDFLSSAEHTITIRNIVEGDLFWDYVRFEPVK